MSSGDVFAFAATALLQHRRRTLLSLLGVAVGVTAVVFLTGLGEGARRYVMNQFASLGTNLVIVLPGKVETKGGLPGVGGVPNDLTLDDALTLKRSLRGAKRVIPVSLANDTVSYQERRRQLIVVGTTPDFFPARQLEIRRGQLLPESALDRGAPVAVIGHTVAQELFRETDPIGEVLRVGDARMRVIGVIEERGQQMGQDVDQMVFAPVATVMRLFNRSSLFRIIIELNVYGDAELVKQQVIDVIIDRHDEEDVTIISQEAILDSLGGILDALTMAVAGIGGISVVVAGIGIMNVMLVSVSERTSEIGLLKALGANRQQVLSVFLTEAALLSMAGGAIGLGLGWAALQLLVTIYPAIPATPPVWAVATVLGLAVVTGPIFGVIPALRAMRMDPVSALTRG
jgi:putative ABC transport system permease protein